MTINLGPLRVSQLPLDLAATYLRSRHYRLLLVVLARPFGGVFVRDGLVLKLDVVVLAAPARDLGP
jgi:hypothetical protein